MNKLWKGIIINVVIIVVAVVLFRTVSYSADNTPTLDNKDVEISTGNMQVVLKTPKEHYNFLDNKKEKMTDQEGIKQNGYTFSIKNTGNIPIEYYEIRLVDQEGKVSTLPHKYIKFTISKDNGEYENIKNLGDNDSIIYSGYNLDVDSSSTFNLKMWIDDTVIDMNGKTLYGAIEVTLYQKFDVYKNYVLYESPESTNVPVRTTIHGPISGTIPTKEGYKFVGWEKKGGTMKYQPLDTYNESVGTTLYAIWEKE